MEKVLDLKFFFGRSCCWNKMLRDVFEWSEKFEKIWEEETSSKDGGI
jgi:hypothetical protein